MVASSGIVLADVLAFTRSTRRCGNASAHSQLVINAAERCRLMHRDGSGLTSMFRLGIGHQGGDFDNANRDPDPPLSITRSMPNEVCFRFALMLFSTLLAVTIISSKIACIIEVFAHQGDQEPVRLSNNKPLQRQPAPRKPTTSAVLKTTAGRPTNEHLFGETSKALSSVALVCMPTSIRLTQRASLQYPPDDPLAGHGDRVSDAGKRRDGREPKIVDPVCPIAPPSYASGILRRRKPIPPISTRSCVSAICLSCR
ncbi:hypothetical protein LAD77_02025 [Klebsiella pneumoniae]|nr:hypothetical protein [Klebsiella pneumoniae]